MQIELLTNTEFDKWLVKFLTEPLEDRIGEYQIWSDKKVNFEEGMVFESEFPDIEPKECGYCGKLQVY